MNVREFGEQGFGFFIPERNSIPPELHVTSDLNSFKHQNDLFIMTFHTHQLVASY